MKKIETQKLCFFKFRVKIMLSNKFSQLKFLVKIWFRTHVAAKTFSSTLHSPIESIPASTPGTFPDARDNE